MKIDLEFMEVVRVKALIDKEIKRDKRLLDVCRNKLYRDLDEDSIEENIKTIALLEKEITALKTTLEKLEVE